MIGFFAAAAAASATCSSRKAPKHRHLPGGLMPERCPLWVCKSTSETSLKAPTAAAIRRCSCSAMVAEQPCLSLHQSGKAGDDQGCFKLELVGSVNRP